VFIPRKLAKLNPRHRMRKAALMLMGAERRMRVAAPAPAAPRGIDDDDIRALMKYLSNDAELPAAIRSIAAESLASSAASLGGSAAIRAINDLRHAILAELGSPVADWDLIDPASGTLDPGSRDVLPGVALYLEDIRSPFHVGTIFRTAEAFGVERILISPRCADPGHPRALRASMGCAEVLPWERLSAPPDLSNAFALELGGTDLGKFSFPKSGVCVLGNEELGVSPETISACGLGRASIPMSGAKASLNVAVAAGVCLAAWREAIKEGRNDGTQ